MKAHKDAGDKCDGTETGPTGCKDLSSYQFGSMFLKDVKKTSVIGLMGVDPNKPDSSSFVFTPFKVEAADGKSNDMVHKSAEDIAAATWAADKAERDKAAAEAAAKYKSDVADAIKLANYQVANCKDESTVRNAWAVLQKLNHEKGDIESIVAKMKTDSESDDLKAISDELRTAKDVDAVSAAGDEVIALDGKYGGLPNCTDARKAGAKFCAGKLILAIVSKLENMRTEASCVAAQNLIASATGLSAIDEKQQKTLDDATKHINLELSNIEIADLKKSVQKGFRNNPNALEKYNDKVEALNDSIQSDCDTTADDFNADTCSMDYSTASQLNQIGAYGQQIDSSMPMQSNMYGYNPGMQMYPTMPGMPQYSGVPMYSSQQMYPAYGQYGVTPGYAPQGQMYGGGMMAGAYGNVGMF